MHPEHNKQKEFYWSMGTKASKARNKGSFHQGTIHKLSLEVAEINLSSPSHAGRLTAGIRTGRVMLLLLGNVV
jgi:hypothetical protein